MNCYCGIDWAEGHHDVAIIDGDGKLVAKKRIGDDPAGFTALTGMLADAGPWRVTGSGLRWPARSPTTPMR